MLRLARLTCFALVSCATAAQPADTLVTRAEATDYRATSRYVDVMEFLVTAAESPGVHLTSFGQSVEGRALPLVVWGARAATSGTVRASEKLRVLVFANIHAGEVAGKEAALMLIRDLAAGRHAAWAETLTLLVAPIYNADGNERFDVGNRPYQHGPVEGMGQRSNADGLDLNRDFVKLDSPEARALTSLLVDYDPHVIIDLHTTNGTVHGYDLTYAPPLHPSTPTAIDALLRERWLPAVTDRYKARHGGDIGYYGNDKPEWGQPRGWATFDPRPRFGTNIAGLRNRVGILSEAYSYATFQDRVLATYHFVGDVVDWASANAGEIRSVIHAADAAPVVGEPVAMRSARRWQANPEPGTILLGEAVEETNPISGAPMLRRTDAQTPTLMTIYGRFEGAEPVLAPAAYLVPDSLSEITDRLALHGIASYPVAIGARVDVSVFEVDSVLTAERPFQRRYEQELFGRSTSMSLTVDSALHLVPVDQALGRLAVLLLEPRSDSGFAGWGLVSATPGEPYPIYRVESRDAAQLLSPSTTQ